MPNCRARLDKRLKVRTIFFLVKVLSGSTCKNGAFLQTFGVNYSIGSFHFFRESEWEKCCGVVAAPEGSFIYGKKSS